MNKSVCYISAQIEAKAEKNCSDNFHWKLFPMLHEPLFSTKWVFTFCWRGYLKNAQTNSVDFVLQWWMMDYANDKSSLLNWCLSSLLFIFILTILEHIWWSLAQLCSYLLSDEWQGLCAEAEVPQISEWDMAKRGVKKYAS